MAEGICTYNGIAVPLCGESEIKQQTIAYDILTLTSAASNTSDFLVFQDSSGTELLRVEDDGRIWQNITEGTASSVNFACYRTMSQTCGDGGQSYAAQFLLDEAETSVAGGRRATLYIRYDAAAADVTQPARSFINFEDHGTLCPQLFVLNSTVANSGGCFVTATNTVIDHALKIYVHGVQYYIGLYDAMTA